MDSEERRYLDLRIWTLLQCLSQTDDQVRNLDPDHRSGLEELLPELTEALRQTRPVAVTGDSDASERL